MKNCTRCLVIVCLGFVTAVAHAQESDRPRAREIGISVGVFEPGQHNAITDVNGVHVGHATVSRGDSVNTGVTVVLPHTENLFRAPVPAAIYVANGYGKLLGIAQVEELGILETPIALTCTLCVWKVADAMTDILLDQPQMSSVRSINPVVGETNDGFLNHIRSKPVSAADVRSAFESATSGPVEEGSVGAGRGTVAFGWKGGIGTSSRVVRWTETDSATVGVLVQSNFGGILTMGGAPVGRELQRYAFRNMTQGTDADGSIMIVVAVDAPVDSRQLKRIAKRSMLGVGRTGGAMTHGSGDFIIAFSTIVSDGDSTRGNGMSKDGLLPDNRLSPIFQAVAEATEEAVYNSMLRATTVVGHRGTVDALDIEEIRRILAKYGVKN